MTFRHFALFRHQRIHCSIASTNSSLILHHGKWRIFIAVDPAYTWPDED